MHAFLQRFATLVLGAVSGLDRVLFRGTLRNLCYPAGLQHYLWANRVPFKDFDSHSQAVTAQLIAASLEHAEATGREIRYLASSSVRKEDIAREIAARDGIRDGLICVLRCVEPCQSFQINRNRATKRLEIHSRRRQCLHLYHYQFHPLFGFMHTRLQTWFPFQITICINGREWLSRQMDAAGLAYQRRDNCFPWLEDLDRAQALLNEQLRTDWPVHLDALAAAVDPTHAARFARFPSHYYWSAAQTEYATDVLFRTRADLEAWYPRWLRHGITTYGAGDVLRFLGHRLPPSGQLPSQLKAEVTSDLSRRQEGVRLKHRLNANSLKVYDKGSVLRVETTIDNPKDFRAYRTAEGDPDGAKAWRPLRLGVADLHRRAEVSHAANGRYLEALAAVPDTTPLRQLAEPLCRPVPEPRRTRTPAAPTPDRAAPALPEPTPPRRPQRRLRALNPLSAEDGTLLQAISRPEFRINGLRNRDLRALLDDDQPAPAAERRRRSAAITRKLRLLRGHGLLHKVPKTHRYVVSEQGCKTITALLAARNANADLLTTNAA